MKRSLTRDRGQGVGGAARDSPLENVLEGSGLNAHVVAGEKSYKDSVMGGQNRSGSQAVEKEVEDSFCPRVEVSKEERREWCKAWKRSLIVKVLGREVSFGFLRNRLLKLWNPKSQMNVLDLGNGHMIDYAIDKRMWNPIKICRSGHELSHVFFADDLILMGEASVLQDERIKRILEVFL
ncbi:hypothetical protein G2W53_041380 [Senna tora]|uniref:Reverse transcriptase n=1 Tax=Senna tora TaxID=362788 RepID=A0A834SF30_9FABA|nr:hypothetical protein G2W53_041380 [Senna tora]